MSEDRQKATPKKQCRASTQSKQALFLEAFAEHGNVLWACKAAEINRTTLYRWKEHSDVFLLHFNQALEDAKDNIRYEIYRRAKEGVEEPVWQLGKYCGTVRKYSDTLLIFQAKMLMPEYRDKQQIDIHATHSPNRDDALQKISDEELDAIASIYQRVTQDS